MRIFANAEIQRLFRRLVLIQAALLLLVQLGSWQLCGRLSLWLALVCLVAGAALLGAAMAISAVRIPFWSRPRRR